MHDQPSSPPLAEAPDVDDYAYVFTPVPGRARTDGWTVERQRAFILALRDTGLVATAARSVGKTHQTAYRLRLRHGAKDFAEAWDRALRDARSDAMAAAIAQTEHGLVSPRFYRGQFVGTVRSHNDRLLIAALRASHARAPAKGDK
jgi:hypothetical protein